MGKNQVFLKYKKMEKYGFSSKRRIKPHTTLSLLYQQGQLLSDHYYSWLFLPQQL